MNTQEIATLTLKEGATLLMFIKEIPSDAFAEAIIQVGHRTNIDPMRLTETLTAVVDKLLSLCDPEKIFD